MSDNYPIWSSHKPRYFGKKGLERVCEALHNKGVVSDNDFAPSAGDYAR